MVQAKYDAIDSQEKCYFCHIFSASETPRRRSAADHWGSVAPFWAQVSRCPEEGGGWGQKGGKVGAAESSHAQPEPVSHFNPSGRVKDRMINTNIPIKIRHSTFKKYILISCIFVSQIIYWSS